jgi:glycerol-3-phosphate dehydrogenase
MNRPEHDFDLVVIGAGINGAGIARDAAMRGLRVAVLDQYDMCSGTSAWSTRLIHGGLRYLEYGEIPLVYESLRERRILRQTAPHLVHPIRIAIPIYEGAKRGPWLIRLGMLAYDLLSLGKAMPAHDMLSADEAHRALPGLETRGLRGAARYWDAQVEFAERLVLENLLGARAAGAEIMTWHRVTSMPVEHGRIRAVEWRDTLAGRSGSLNAAVVINAAGPWVDAVLETTATPAERLIGGTKGSHLVVGRFSGAPDDAVYVEALEDGRPIFVVPWNGQVLIGTTDIRFDDRPEAAHADEAEIDYLLAEANRVFPRARLARTDIHYTYSGVRPLPHVEKGPASAITRRHIIRRNDRVASNLLSIIGGKLTTYRSLAEQAVDRAASILGREPARCATADTLLPGGGDMAEAQKRLARLSTLPAASRERLLRIYGRRAVDVGELVKEDPALGATLGDGAAVAAEVVFAIREEFARTLADIVHRRLMIGLDPEQGRSAYADVASVAAREFGWDSEARAAALVELERYSDGLGQPQRTASQSDDGR